MGRKTQSINHTHFKLSTSFTRYVLQVVVIVSGWLVVSLPAFYAVSRCSRHTEDYHKNGTSCLSAWHAGVRVESVAVQSDCVKGWVVCGNLFDDTHFKYHLGPIARVGYRIPVPDFHLVLHCLRCLKKHSKKNSLTLIDSINTSKHTSKAYPKVRMLNIFVSIKWDIYRRYYNVNDRNIELI